MNATGFQFYVLDSYETALEQLQSVGELFLNLLYGVLPIKEAFRQKLIKHRRLIEYLANKKHSVKKRKSVLLRKKTSVIQLFKISVSSYKANI